MCEPGVFGEYCEEPCPNAYFGQNCSEKCDCMHASSCDAFTGECQCLPGYAGPQCNETCKVGYFGHNCSYSCTCNKNTTAGCSPITGECSCLSGWQGPRCDAKCSPNTWGQNCQRECSCMNNNTCHHLTGKCMCARGWMGTDCSETCPKGFFGDHCREVCDCSPAKVCDPRLGCVFPLSPEAGKHMSWFAILLIIILSALTLLVVGGFIRYYKRKSKADASNIPEAAERTERVDVQLYQNPTYINIPWMTDRPENPDPQPMLPVIEEEKIRPVFKKSDIDCVSKTDACASGYSSPTSNQDYYSNNI